MTLLLAVAALLLGYFIGSFPSADLAARLKRRRIFEVGSANMGAMNTARNLGWRLGVLVLVLDVGKGALASYAGLQFGYLSALAAALGAVTGHLGSVWVGFRGGKGLSTTFGTALALYPLGGLYAFVTLLALIALTRRVTLASVVTALAYPLCVYLGSVPEVRLENALVAGLTALLVAYKHLRPSLPVTRSVAEP